MLLLLAIAGIGAAAFLIRFVVGDRSPYYTALVERGDFTPTFSARATLGLEGEIVMTAPRDGRVAWVASGSSAVDRGTTVLRFDDAAARADAALASAQASAAAANLEAAQITAQEISARLERFEGVWRRSGGRAPSLNEMEAARAEFRRAELAREAARAALDAARIRLAKARAGAHASEVRAPIAGTVIRWMVASGQVVRAGQPLLTMAAGKAPLIIDVTLPPGSGNGLPSGATIAVLLDTLPEAPQIARLRRLASSHPGGSALSAAARSHAIFALDKPDPRAAPGMSATVTMQLPVRRGVLLVPDAAVSVAPAAASATPPGNRGMVLVIDEDGEPRRVDIRLGGSDGKRTEVSGAGLQPGDKIVIGWRAPATPPAQSGP